ncbi:MAG: prepilin-type N-terminal cleavage/methylation domain-containing protein [Coxiellaceae bacterium]|nr:prepilin-type N-terminal cleavage/methylation domain-containing protein [Coxiellaceae bacterium]
MIKYPNKKIRGVTLVELIIVIVLIGIVAGIMGTIFRQVANTYTIQKQISETSWQARLALFRMERELTEAINLTSSTSSTLLSFVSPQDGSTVNYSRTGTVLYRGNSPIARNVSAFSVGGLNSSFVSTSTVSEIHCVTLDLSISHDNQTIPLSTTVCPRNLA